MGSAPVHHLGTIMMKFLLLIAAIASVRAEAEANPAFTYATGYLPYAYGAPLAYAHAPLVYTAAAGCQNEAGAVVPCAHGGVESCLHLTGVHQTNCVRQCISPSCYNILYAPDLLEEAEIDVRLNSFKGCFHQQLETRK